MRRDRIFLARRSLGVGGCSMRITEDVRKFAAEHGITEEAAIKERLKQKATEFTNAGSEIYAKA